MHSPTEYLVSIAKRILRYLKATLDHGLLISASYSFDPKAYNDADWAGCLNTRWSTSGYCIFLESNLVSWSAKKQTIISKSNTEAEFRAMSSTAAEIAWTSFMLHDLCIPIVNTPLLLCDKISALHLSVNPVFHSRSKHFDLDYHYVRERVDMKLLQTQYNSTKDQLADLFTKSLLPLPFQNIISNLNLYSKAELEGG